KLEFPHPRTGDILKLQCSLPDDIKNLIEKIK
ncbi:RluA family pseudouridine synthase, partial [Clostridium botulinum]|nr:RluA family pseudouridine synthase [Clostridium botulinum]